MGGAWGSNRRVCGPHDHSVQTRRHACPRKHCVKLCTAPPLACPLLPRNSNPTTPPTPFLRRGPRRRN
eukprot:2419013-Prymnesium_polylepis.1